MIEENGIDVTDIRAALERGDMATVRAIFADLHEEYQPESANQNTHIPEPKPFFRCRRYPPALYSGYFCLNRRIPVKNEWDDCVSHCMRIRDVAGKQKQ